MIIGGRAHNVEQAAALAESGMPFAEISILNAGMFQRNALDRLRSLQEAHGISFLAHGPEEGNAWEPEVLRRELLPRINRITDCLHALSIPLLTIHFWIDSRFIEPRIIEQKILILRDMAHYAADRGVQICLENLSERAVDFEPAFSAISELGMTLDIGHGELLSEQNTSYDFLAKYAEKIYHMHIHDNRGGSSPDDDLHLTPGEGVIDFDAIITAARRQGFDRTITIEVTPGRALEGKRYIQQLWDARQPQGETTR